MVVRRLSFDRCEAADYIKKTADLNKDKNKTYHIVTYGCQMNVHDSERLAGMLEAMGYKKCEDRREADIIIFNTCCVRENAELRLYGNVGALRELKESRPDMRIAICGCMMQQPEVAEHIKKRFDFVDIVFGSHNTHSLPKLLFESLMENERQFEIIDDAQTIIENEPVHRDSSFSAWITVGYGCNNFCSYCIVPYVRGRERSRCSADIIAEAEKAASNGCVEITLLGQNVNSYGKDCGEISFAELLRRLNAVEGLERINFMTSHPKDCSLELLQAIADCDKVSKQLHLPVQSGSNRILKHMNRKYTREDYIALAKKAKEIIPGVALTTDIIVGFPGETESDFADTMDLYREVGYASAYTFIYSKRNGTPAARMKEQIPLDVKKERLSRLIALQSECTAEFQKRYIGGVYMVLVESVSKRSKKMLSGRTLCGRMVSFPADASLIGKTVPVRIIQAKANTLSGVLETEEQI